MPSELPPIFVISLAREHRRRTHMEQELAGFDHELLDAVDGRTVDASSYAHRLDTEWYRIMRGRALSKGEIGCFLSHYRLWEHLVEREFPCAVVLEDDVRLQDGFKEVIAEAMSIQNEWDIAYLAPMKRPLRMTRRIAALDSGRSLIQCRRRTGTVSYLIRLRAAETLLHHCWRIRAPIDHLYSGWWDNRLRFYAVDPAIVHHAGMPSTVTLGVAWPKLKRTVPEHTVAYLYRNVDALLSRVRGKGH